MESLRLQLSNALSSCVSVSSNQLYGVIVGLTVFGCWGILSLAEQPELPELQTVVQRVQRKKEGPEPKWHLFRWVNMLVVVAFACSVAEFSLNATAYDSNVLCKFLIAWSLLLCYFFGFFGVMFVHDLEDSETVTTPVSSKSSKIHPPASSTPFCSDVIQSKQTQVCSEDIKNLKDSEIAQLVLTNQIKDHELEKKLDCHRAVTVRRLVVQQKLASLGHSGALEGLPYQTDLDYSRVHGANCEIVVGYVPLPVGMVGPLTINGESFYIPMATTEGCLVASTNRGAKAITEGGGAFAQIVRDGITRAPCIRMPTAMAAAQLKIWCETPENFLQMKAAFESTTSFGKLNECKATIAGKNVYLRLVCFSGDAMGMNMVSKGTLAVIEYLRKEFPELSLVALSGNMCTDKKAAATNWLEGRGKSVVVEATIPKDVVRKTLKTTVCAIVETNLNKNLVGSAMAGVIGGFNAHASNIVSAVFLATGQDPAQNVESSNCITLMEETECGDLWISCTMPSIEVGTVGGGTSLAAQAACLKALGCQGGGENPGDNAQRLAKVIASATMAGELSLLAALAANTLVAAHMQHNRKPTK
ncbi:hydroxymethylglutaryl-CoA reductase (NADPH) [Fistulifera solaris]|uniref:3-hydroxy-3-methylglutaryl coenzyme A reductase n=1 Tax=Fistulifera solaris TaxID=1519565 RepID=A0A1Z5JRB7_FISSO|nr:hydroxymethylglutaryl-CoA reductase (NADPH) [Fistulifera solaris]|eukprot:GAX16557.1 hydroxymethylglutaryl-CoA reductase (NADPH) [Fistulifera solaris]